MAGPDQQGWQAELQRRAQQLGVADRLHWLGMVSGDLKSGAFHAAALFCLPSHQENFGIAVAEALACGICWRRWGCRVWVGHQPIHWW